MDVQFRIEMLGGLRVRRGEVQVKRFRTRKAAELLAYLAYFRRVSHPREILIELLWPECDETAGRHSLNMALSFLRKELEPTEFHDGAIILADRHEVSINWEYVTTDVDDFESALNCSSQTGRERILLLGKAISLYAGPLLPGFYGDWVFPEQQRMEELFTNVLQ